jgi:acetoin utilization deacetylase AcuC-like enzyme
MRVFYDPSFNDTGLDWETTRKASEIAQSLADRPIPGVEVVSPTVCTRDEIAVVHAASYVDAVFSGVPLSLAGSNGIGWDDRLAGAASASTGGVRDAALHALATGGIAGSLSSGLHHADHATGRGFCTFNGLVVAAQAALATGARRVLILDLDAHCGGGTASLIDGLDGVEQVDVSVDRYDRYESRPDARLTMSDGSDYLDAVERAIAGIEAPSEIDLVLYTAGMDPHGLAGGAPDIDDEVLRTRERLVFDWVTSHRLPTAWVLAGGYTQGLTMVELVELHRITIRAAAAVHAASA